MRFMIAVIITGISVIVMSIAAIMGCRIIAAVASAVLIAGAITINRLASS